MQVVVEETSAIGRKLTITIPAAEIQSEYDKKIKDALRFKRLQGFRPGKAPKQLIEQKFGTQAREEAIGEIIKKSLPTVLQEKALEPAGRPEIVEIKNMHTRGQDLTYVVNLEIFPEVKIPDFSKMQFKKYQVNITSADVEKALHNLRQQLGALTPVDRPAKKGDTVTIDYVSLLNGKIYENNSGQDVSVELGSHSFIEGFEEGLLDAKPNEIRELDLHFPNEWHMKHLAGKPVHFAITVKSVSEKHLAELDEAFANKIGAAGTDVEAIQNKVRANLEKQCMHAIEETLQKEVLDALLAANDMMLPKALVEHEAALLHEDLHRRMGNKAVESCHHQGLEENARRRVAISLILQKIVKLEGLKPDEKKVRARVSEIAKSFGNGEFIESVYYESKELIAGIRNSVLVGQLIGLILDKASIIQEPITCEALLKRTD